MENKKLDISQEFKCAGFVYKEIKEIDVQNMSQDLKKKFELAKKLCTDTKKVEIYDKKNSR